MAQVLHANRTKQLLLRAAVVGSAPVAGLCIARWPLATMLVLLAAVTLFLARPVARALLRAGDGLNGAPAFTSENRDTAENDGLRVPRALYLLATAVLAMITIRPGGAFTLSDLLYLITLLLTITALTLTGRISLSGLPPSLIVGIALYSSGAVLSSLATEQLAESLAMWVRLIYLTVPWFWLGTQLLTTPTHVRSAAWCWGVSSALTGGGAVLQYLFGDVIPGTSPVYGRMTGFTEHVNDLGGAIGIGFVPILMLIATSAKGPRMVALLGLLPFASAGLLLSGSLGGIAGAGAAILIWVIVNHWNGRALLLGAGIALAAAAVLFTQRALLEELTLDRLRSTTDTQSAACTVCKRMEANYAAFDAISEQPLIGVGLDLAGSTTVTGDRVHNMLLGAWFQAGLLGFIGMLVIVGSLAKTALANLRGARSQAEAQLALALLAAYAGFLVVGMSTPVLFQRYGWITGALLVAMRAQQQARSRAVTARARPHRPALAMADYVKA